MKQNIPEKYHFHNKEKSKEQIFAFDGQGWPQYKQTIRDAIIAFGLTYNEETKKWEIDDSDERLDTPLLKLCDDGMGYGVNEEYVTEISCFKSDGKMHCNLFVESEINNIQLWLKSKFYPGAWVSKKGENVESSTNHYMLESVYEQDGEIMFSAKQYAELDNGGTKDFKTVELNVNEIWWD